MSNDRETLMPQYWQAVLKLRLVELIFAFTVMLLVFVLFEERTTKLDVTYFLGKARYTALICATYLTTMLYWPYCLFLFAVTKLALKMAGRKWMYVNALAYTSHSLPFMYVFAVEPLQVELWLVWLAVIIFNFFAPTFFLANTKETDGSLV